MPAVTVFRGFKVSVPVIDAYLWAKGQDETFGYPPLPDKDADISNMLRTEMNSKGSAVEGEGEGEGEAKGDIKSQVADARVIIPQREAYNNSDTAYVAYTWVDVFAQRRVDLDAELSEQVPAPFERLQESILSFRHSEGEGEGEGAQDPGQPEARDDGGSGIGFFVVYTGSRDWIPEGIRQRAKPPISCDQCDATFNDWFSRQRHRNTEHGSQEGGNPLPRT